MNADQLQQVRPGFHDAALGSQAVFRVALQALSHPGRVLEMPLGQVDRLAKLVPQNPAAPVTLKPPIGRAAVIAAEPFRGREPVSAVAMSCSGFGIETVSDSPSSEISP